MSVVRTLIVTDGYPWPTSSGYAIRLVNNIAALAELGPIDLFSYVWQSCASFHQPPEGLLSRFKVVTRAETPKGIRLQLLRLRAIATPSVPRRLSIASDRKVRAEFLDWVQPPYDLAMVVRADPYVRFRDLINAHLIIDIDDLESSKLSEQLRTRSADYFGAAHYLAARSKGFLDAWEVNRWRRLERTMAKDAQAVLVCSKLDKQRLGVPNCVVIPNGYEPIAPIQREATMRPPTLTYIGLMSYDPNCDGALFLVDKVLPKIRSEVPEVDVRIVGLFDSRFEAIMGRPNVTVTGFVEDLALELSRADVAVVPLRFGSGTRIKILEAFAYGIPVVSTPVGCEGLCALDGEHLLIADGPDAFAAACVRLLRNPSDRIRIGNAGHRLWEQRFRWPTIRRRLTDLATAVVNNKRPFNTDGLRSVRAVVDKL
jgi:glycosyltransferase involved in cell wall biosynthesis